MPKFIFNSFSMNSCASSPNLRMSDWENRPTNARCPDKKKQTNKYVSSALRYSRITQINRRSMLHVGELTHKVDRTTCSLYWIRWPMFFFQFFFQGFFLGRGGGRGALKLRSYCRIFSRLPYLSTKYAFSGFEKQLHKNYGTDFYQIWYNGASYHRTDLRKIWHLSLQKCESRIFLSSSYRWRVRQCSELRCTHMYVIWPSGVFIYLFEGHCSMLGYKIPPKSTHSELTHKKPSKLYY